MTDMVNHPPHYTSHPSGVECIQITEHMNFNLGNAVKYIWRAGLKTDDPVRDLEKAEFYVRREIARLKPKHDAAVIEASMEAIKAAVLAEREACAALCDEEAIKYARQHYPELEAVADECSGKIMARGGNG